MIVIVILALCVLYYLTREPRVEDLIFILTGTGLGGLLMSFVGYEKNQNQEPKKEIKTWNSEK